MVGGGRRRGVNGGRWKEEGRVRADGIAFELRRTIPARS